MNSSDIYEISNLVNDIQKKHMSDVSETTLAMGMYGYMNEVFSNQMQNALIAATEWGNEAFPIRAKFDKNILTYAITYNIKNINAIPASMQIMVGFIIDELDDKLVGGIFTLDKESKLYVEDIEYHLDYDIIIQKTLLSGGNSVYSARYNMDRNNVLSDIENPYLESPVFLNIDNDKFLFISCMMHQVETGLINKKIISTNILENKTIDFDFTAQLATFDVVVITEDETVFLTPVFEGMPIQGKDLYCFYTYIDSNNIRIKFDINSYDPALNSEVQIRLKTTSGSAGNFIYKDDIIQTVSSTNYNYKNLSILIKPMTDSVEGIDRKTTDELKQIIPKEILARGNITNNKDIENFFNAIGNSKLIFYKRRNNQFERLYYAYMLIKDIENNVIPTNTISLSIKESEFDIITNNRYILKTGHLLEYTNPNCVVNDSLITSDVMDTENHKFLYGLPFTCIVNKFALSVSYYLDIVNNKYNFKYAYINQNTSLQFISSLLNCRRIYIEGTTYKLTMNITQNINTEYDLVTIVGGTEITSSKIKPVLVINQQSIKYYVYGKIIDYDSSLFTYKVEFELDCTDIISDDNHTRINNVYVGGSDALSYAYLPSNIDMSVYIYTKFDEDYGRSDADSIIPNMEGYTLCNRYDTYDKVSLFTNYSSVVKSTVTIDRDISNGYVFNIKGIPVVKYSYLNNIDKCLEFIEYLQYRKIYIDEAITVLEDSFSIDFKFFNTYGASKMFYIGYEDTILDKVNLTINYKIRLVAGADKNTKALIIDEIKTYIENINTKVSTNTHISNLTTYLETKFKTSVEFIEFQGINDYNALVQYIKKIDLDAIECVPEFLNISIDNNNPAINISLV